MATRKLERARLDQPEISGDPPSGNMLASAASDAAGAASRGLAGAGAVTFEQAIARLGEIVESLEEGEQPLEESIALFEEGMTLAKSSQEILERAERRIEELLGVDAQGKPVVREIEPD